MTMMNHLSSPRKLLFIPIFALIFANLSLLNSSMSWAESLCTTISPASEDSIAEKISLRCAVSTDRLILRSFETHLDELKAQDAQRFWLYQDLEVTRLFMSQRPATDVELAEIRAEAEIGFTSKYPYGFFLAFKKTNSPVDLKNLVENPLAPHPEVGEYVGIFVVLHAWTPGGAEIGYLTDPRHQRQGFTYEGAQAVTYDFVPYLNSISDILQLDFSAGKSQSRTSRLKRLYGTVSPENLGSVKILDKLQFKAFPPEHVSSLQDQSVTLINAMLTDERGIDRTLGKRYDKDRYFLYLDVKE